MGDLDAGCCCVVGSVEEVDYLTTKQVFLFAWKVFGQKMAKAGNVTNVYQKRKRSSGITYVIRTTFFHVFGLQIRYAQTEWKFEPFCGKNED